MTARRSVSRHRDGARRGIILIAVLWTLVLASALGMATSVSFRSFTGIAGVESDLARANGLLLAGLEIGAGLVHKRGPAPLQESETEFQLSGGSVRVHLSDESGRIDLRRAPVELLVGLLRSLGTSDRESEEVARRIVELRQTVAAMTGIRQVAQSLGMPEAWSRRVAPLVTVFGRETVNPLTASPAVLAAVPGLDGTRVTQFLEVRKNSFSAAERMVTTLGPGQRFLAVGPRQAVSLRISAKTSRGSTASALASIVILPGDSEPYRVLVWSSSPSNQLGRP